MKIKVFAILTVLFMLLTVSSCGYTEKDFSGGTPVNDSIIDAAKDLAEGTDPPKYEKVIGSDGLQIVFWTDGGSVYHTSKDCTTLSKSKNINSGSVDSAAVAGKSRGCSTCTK